MVNFIVLNNCWSNVSFVLHRSPVKESRKAARKKKTTRRSPSSSSESSPERDESKKRKKPVAVKRRDSSDVQEVTPRKSKKQTQRKVSPSSDSSPTRGRKVEQYKSPPNRKDSNKARNRRDSSEEASPQDMGRKKLPERERSGTPKRRVTLTKRESSSPERRGRKGGCSAQSTFHPVVVYTPF